MNMFNIGPKPASHKNAEKQLTALLNEMHEAKPTKAKKVKESATAAPSENKRTLGSRVRIRAFLKGASEAELNRLQFVIDEMRG